MNEPTLSNMSNDELVSYVEHTELAEQPLVATLLNRLMFSYELDQITEEYQEQIDDIQADLDAADEELFKQECLVEELLAEIEDLKDRIEELEAENG